MICVLRAKFLFSGALLVTCLYAAGADRDFSGTWNLDRVASQTRQLPTPDVSLTVTQGDDRIQCNTGAVTWLIPLDGGETHYRSGDEKWSSASKWEGDALLINTLVTGGRDYTIMDRWRLSHDRQTLTIQRHILRGTAETEGQLVYRRPGVPMSDAKPADSPALVRRPPPSETASAPSGEVAEREYVVPAGTRVLLSLINSVDTKHSREGDRVYLRTAFPVIIDGRTVVPRGSNVTGVVSKSKQPGRVTGKGELYIRFEDLVLPNGVTREFRSRLGSADGGSGEVDRNEGTIRGQSDKGGDARTVATGA